MANCRNTVLRQCTPSTARRPLVDHSSTTRRPLVGGWSTSGRQVVDTADTTRKRWSTSRREVLDMWSASARGVADKFSAAGRELVDKWPTNTWSTSARQLVDKSPTRGRQTVSKCRHVADMWPTSGFTKDGHAHRATWNCGRGSPAGGRRRQVRTPTPPLRVSSPGSAVDGCACHEWKEHTTSFLQCVHRHTTRKPPRGPTFACPKIAPTVAQSKNAHLLTLR